MAHEICDLLYEITVEHFHSNLKVWPFLFISYQRTPANHRSVNTFIDFLLYSSIEKWQVSVSFMFDLDAYVWSSGMEDRK